MNDAQAMRVRDAIDDFAGTRERFSHGQRCAGESSGQRLAVHELEYEIVEAARSRRRGSRRYWDG